MRIIAGSRKGLRLISAKSNAIRPTADSTKELMFNVIGGDVRGSHVLDIYAGTGSLGIEALSRGATRAIFIESSQHARTVLSRNLKASGFEHQAEIIKFPAESALKHLGKDEMKFNVIFADPPYKNGLAETTVDAVRTNHLLAQSGWLIIEHSFKTELQSNPEYELKIRKRQGETSISFYHYEA